MHIAARHQRAAAQAGRAAADRRGEQLLYICGGAVARKGHHAAVKADRELLDGAVGPHQRAVEQGGLAAATKRRAVEPLLGHARHSGERLEHHACTVGADLERAHRAARARRDVELHGGRAAVERHAVELAHIVGVLVRAVDHALAVGADQEGRVEAMLLLPLIALANAVGAKLYAAAGQQRRVEPCKRAARQRHAVELNDIICVLVADVGHAGAVVADLEAADRAASR